MTFEKNGFDFESLQVDLVFLIIKKAFLTQNILNIYKNNTNVNRNKSLRDPLFFKIENIFLKNKQPITKCYFY
jgi:hypothetical protein